ncbi:hypothetical protein DVH24_031164 [Malus domestica]|uniref:Uncharacterized protein n=1 Tax=Malus domestica TaxID=3750 RepID=A0A498HI86_MALDO|nr:hypothetical protein DVH24_031164 [Malus domestica]
MTSIYMEFKLGNWKFQILIFTNRNLEMTSIYMKFKLGNWNTRPFGSSLASGSVGTPKLSEKEVITFLGWVTHWEVAREFPKTKP